MYFEFAFVAVIKICTSQDYSGMISQTTDGTVVIVYFMFLVENMSQSQQLYGTFGI